MPTDPFPEHPLAKSKVLSRTKRSTGLAQQGRQDRHSIHLVSFRTDPQNPSPKSESHPPRLIWRSGNQSPAVTVTQTSVSKADLPYSTSHPLLFLPKTSADAGLFLSFFFGCTLLRLDVGSEFLDGGWNPGCSHERAQSYPRDHRGRQG